MPKYYSSTDRPASLAHGDRVAFKLRQHGSPTPIELEYLVPSSLNHLSLFGFSHQWLHEKYPMTARCQNDALFDLLGIKKPSELFEEVMGYKADGGIWPQSICGLTPFVNIMLDIVDSFNKGISVAQGIPESGRIPDPNLRPLASSIRERW